jgi:uncharacterized Fe-S cluster-containing protein
MQKITAFKTQDGVIHESYKLAKDHAERLYGNQLTKMAHELVRIEKYTNMVDVLDGYKGSMSLLLKLSDDLHLLDTREETC